MKNSMITKVQFKKDKLTIQWEEIRNGHRDKRSLETRIQPHQDFFNALHALDKPLCVEAELPHDEDEYKRHDVQVVMCDYDEDNHGDITMSVSIISERFMEGTEETMKIASPMKPETGEMPIETDTREKVNVLLDEAQKFLDGKRYDLFSVTPQQEEVLAN